MPLSTSIASLVWRIVWSKGKAERSKTTESNPALVAFHRTGEAVRMIRIQEDGEIKFFP
jgi:hypothetical protein